MADFYRLPHWMLTALVMMAAVCIVLQTQTIAYSISRLHTGWVRRIENGMECAILVTLVLFTALLAKVQYALFCEFLAPSSYDFVRQLAFWLVALLSIIAAMGKESMWPLFVVGGAAVLLPVVEKITGSAYPLFFLLSILFFLIRSVHIYLIRNREVHTQISAVSVKEAIDTLHTGLLFFRPEGEILLYNHQMDVLVKQMTGQSLQNGKAFQLFLEGGSLLGGCIRETVQGQKVFRFPDSSVWSITTHNIPLAYRTLILMIADDITAQWNAVTQLNHQNQDLKKRGQELCHTIENLQAICEAEEIARSKSRIHDLLGQRISLLLRALRDEQQPNETLLMDFVRNLPTAIREDHRPSPVQRLEILKETFQKMDVSVEIRGELPEDTQVADDFAEIAVECVTNAVRHGYANRIQFHFFQNDCWRMTVTDNGIPSDKPIREGGGIIEMRRRINRLGGTLELYTVPRFCIQIFVPKEDVRR